jgi:hypothetical protein
MTRDVAVGIVAGTVALVALRWRGGVGEPPRLPPGIYQASIDQAKYRAVMRALEPVAVTTRETRQKLAETLAPFAVSDVRLEGLIAYVADVGGVDIEVDWAGLNLDRNAAVSLKVEQPLTVAQALRAAVETVKLDGQLSFAIEPGRVRVTGLDQAARERVVRVYDVRDILRAAGEADQGLRARTAPPAALPFSDRGVLFGDSRDFADFATTPRRVLSELVEFLQTRVDRSSWLDTGGSVGSITAFEGRLIVAQTPSNHEDVAVLLQWVRDGLMK